MQELTNKHRNKVNGRWTQQQHLIFLEGLRVYGKNWKQIENLLKTRTGTQIRSHAQKFFMKNQENIHKNQGEIINSTDFLEKQSLLDSQKLTNAISHNLEGTNTSYYLNKILQHSTCFGLIDFWNALIDQKHQTNNKKLNYYKNSFELYTKTCNQPLSQTQQ